MRLVRGRSVRLAKASPKAKLALSEQDFLINKKVEDNIKWQEEKLLQATGR